MQYIQIWRQVLINLSIIVTKIKESPTEKRPDESPYRADEPNI